MSRGLHPAVSSHHPVSQCTVAAATPKHTTTCAPASPPPAHVWPAFATWMHAAQSGAAASRPHTHGMMTGRACLCAGSPVPPRTLVAPKKTGSWPCHGHSAQRLLCIIHTWAWCGLAPPPAKICTKTHMYRDDGKSTADTSRRATALSPKPSRHHRCRHRCPVYRCCCQRRRARRCCCCCCCPARHAPRHWPPPP